MRNSRLETRCFHTGWTRRSLRLMSGIRRQKGKYQSGRGRGRLANGALFGRLGPWRETRTEVLIRDDDGFRWDIPSKIVLLIREPNPVLGGNLRCHLQQVGWRVGTFHLFRRKL